MCSLVQAHTLNTHRHYFYTWAAWWGRQQGQSRTHWSCMDLSVWPVRRRVNKLQTLRPPLLYSHPDWNSRQTDNPHLYPLLCFFHTLSSMTYWHDRSRRRKQRGYADRTHQNTPLWFLTLRLLLVSVVWGVACRAAESPLFAKSVWNHKHPSTPMWWQGEGGGEGVWPCCYLFQ